MPEPRHYPLILDTHVWIWLLNADAHLQKSKALHWIEQAALRFHVPVPGITNREVERAQLYEWPGNVRELQNVIERAVIMSHGGVMALDLKDASPPPAAAEATETGEVIPEPEWTNRERANILNALRRAGFRVSGKGGAAELLGVKPSTLSSRIKALGIERP